MRTWKLPFLMALSISAGSALGADFITCSLEGGEGGFGEDQMSGSIEISRDGVQPLLGVASITHPIDAAHRSGSRLFAWKQIFYARAFNTDHAFKRYEYHLKYDPKDQKLFVSLGNPDTRTGAYSSGASGKPVFVQMFGETGLVEGAIANLSVGCEFSGGTRK